MSYLHLHNIIHRDLKPENILMDTDLYPKITDFGLSKFTDLNQESTSQKSLAGFKGTFLYSAPEIINDFNYTKAGDVYAFAMIAYEIMAVEKLFNKCTIKNLIIKVMNGIRPDFNPSIPDSYQNLIEKCWAEDPMERPSFDQIVDELKNNPGFITDLVEEEHFWNYVSYIDDCEISFNKDKKVLSFTEFMNLKLGKSKINENEISSKNQFESIQDIQNTTQFQNPDQNNIQNQQNVHNQDQNNSQNQQYADGFTDPRPYIRSTPDTLEVMLNKSILKSNQFHLMKHGVIIATSKVKRDSIVINLGTEAHFSDDFNPGLIQKYSFNNHVVTEGKTHYVQFFRDADTGYYDLRVIFYIVNDKILMTGLKKMPKEKIFGTLKVLDESHPCTLFFKTGETAMIFKKISKTTYTIESFINSVSYIFVFAIFMCVVDGPHNRPDKYNNE